MLFRSIYYSSYSRLPQLQRVIHFYTICAVIILRTKARIRERILNNNSSDSITLSPGSLVDDQLAYGSFHEYHLNDIYDETSDIGKYPSGLNSVKRFCQAFDEEEFTRAEFVGGVIDGEYVAIYDSPSDSGKYVSATWSTSVGDMYSSGEGWRNYAFAWRKFLRNWMQDLEDSLAGFDEGDEIFLNGKTFDQILDDLKLSNTSTNKI